MAGCSAWAGNVRLVQADSDVLGVVRALQYIQMWHWMPELAAVQHLALLGVGLNQFENSQVWVSSLAGVGGIPMFCLFCLCSLAAGDRFWASFVFCRNCMGCKTTRFMQMAGKAAISAVHLRKRRKGGFETLRRRACALAMFVWHISIAI